MQPNMIEMLTTVGSFGLFMLVVLLVLRKYRKSSKSLPFPKLDQFLRHANFFKCLFVAGAIYFGVFLVSQHTDIGCEDLHPNAQCPCYALQLKDHKNQADKLHWANNGARMCPDSTVFKDYLTEHSAQ